MNSPNPTDVELPQTCLPAWEVGELPEPKPLSWRNWTSFIGPGIVMMGIQIGGGEWLLGPEVTARYGGSLMWIATVAIVLQVFYNLECGRYALYCGEPIMTGFLRTRPGPKFWLAVIALLNCSALIPGLSTHAAAVCAAMWLGRPPGEDDRGFVMGLAYVFLALVALPVLIGGKIYNTLQTVMTAKVIIVLGFCLGIGVCFVSPQHWADIFSGFLKFGAVPTTTADGRDAAVNLVSYRLSEGEWPVIALANIAVLGAFAGYAGGGGLANSTYSNYVRDKGWGMGSKVGAIASAFGGHQISLSHVGQVFPLNEQSRRRWSQWWRYLMTDQLLVWGPGCFMGMALPALISLEFAPFSPLYHEPKKLDWAQAIISADGLRHAPEFSPALQQFLWLLTLFVGLMVLLPSQMSIIEDISRRWTDILWTSNLPWFAKLEQHRVKHVYYSIFFLYLGWSFFCAWIFSQYGSPKLMTLIIANLNNLAIGWTAFHLLWVNSTLLPRELRPRWYQRTGLILCGVFYMGLALLVFMTKQWPELAKWWGMLSA